ncbi:cell surface protein [Bifidobacterium pseudocatenulatum]|uniref:Spy0128 family protein n=1 Tax=Bifidobacterium pseudocatenulatum TaxID=28026 RepID=UPI001CFDC14E|nr:FctA domain-containing protein [Bifidobacterium pseudocatenulatum]MCB4902658.1 cell surface protein [Bifidobacterium pseudocatenulatum]
MKPGLRKIAALILASATLFGGGVLSASTAYADDTTLDTSTQLQAEPDTQTTMGGDVSETTPDNGSDNEAGTDTDNQSDDTTPQTNVGQAAPDVTIHDMLDTDSATVSKLKLTGWTTGTAPFDKDNERGDDKDDNNAIVRSYDTVTYDYDYTLTPDDAMTYYRKARVGFRFELPYPSNKVTFATDQMNWVDQTPGYTAKVTQEGDRQVFTAYRLLTPTSNSPTVCPGTSSITLAVKVLGASNGYRFHPTVKAWTVPNDTSNRIVSDTPKDVTVSAKLSLNVRMVNYGINDRGVFDFSSGAANAPNKTEGKVTGLGLGIALVTEMRWPDRTKGLKGLEAPSGRITYRLRLSNQYSDDTKTGTKHPMERRWQPLLYDYGHISNMDSKYGRTFAWMGDMLCQAPGVADHADGYVRVARGNTTVTSTTGEQGTDVTVSFDGYDTSVFPIHEAYPRNNQDKCSTHYMSSGCSTQQVGAIHVDVLQFITPTSRDGKTVAQYYGNVEQTGNISMDDMGLTATGVSGDRLATAEDNSNQAVTGDDHAGSAVTVRIPGTYSTRVRYTYWSNDRSTNDAGTSGDWTTPDCVNGSDSLIQGSKLRLQIGHNIIINSEGDAEVMGMGLVKFDPNSIEPVDDHPDTQPTIFMNAFTWGTRVTKQRNQIPYWYAVKKDGTGWKDYKEQRDTKISGLDYYPTLNEAKRHGTVVGMLFEDHNTVDPTGTSFNRRFTPIVSLPARILDTARIGTVTPIVAETAYWTRNSLARIANLNADAPDTQWQQWSDNLTTRLPEYANSVKPNLTCSGDTYRPATFDENGVYQGGDTADTIKGDSLYVAGETPHIAKQVAQANEAGHIKTVYDLDKEQRTVDWKLTATADTSTTTDGGQYTTDYIITDTLPKGLTYVDGSMTVGGQYTQHTPDKGTVTGGTPVTPTIVVNKDGTTTMTIRVNGARADSGTQTVIHYSTTIGDASDPDHDVRNNDSFTNHATIQSKRNMAPPLAPKAQIADMTVRVSRTRATALATRADPLLNDINRPLGFRNMLGNFSKDEKTDPYAVDVMPYKGLNQSNYHGDYVMAGLTVKAGAGASMNGVTVYFTTDPKWRNVDATKITREQVTQWTEATVNATTGKVTIPDGYSKPVAWAFTSPSLPANARYDFTLSIKPTGNSASDMYVNRWADGDNKVDAVTQVVERKVNGVAWFDTNHDGIRQDSDRLLAGVNVTLVDGNGRTVTSVNGKPCTTTTDGNGHYEIGSIPAGSGFKLRFTPKTGITWHGQHTTVKNAKEASEATDSDSDEEDDAGGNMIAGVIRLKDFPALDKMTSAVYDDPNEDHGMSGTLMPAVPATFKAVKVLNGRPNGAWTDRDKYVADITPLDNAPKGAVPASITFSDNRTKTVKINPSAFTSEGTYRYQVKERKGDNAGVTYDSRTWILTVTVADDLTTFKRHVTVNAACDGVQSDTIQFTNTYAPKDTQAVIEAGKLFTNADRSATKITDFQFDLYANDKATGTPIQTVNATADGRVDFSPLLFTKAKLNGKDKAVFNYSVRERNTGAAGVKYDGHYAAWTVTVTDDNSGQLKANVTNPSETEGRFVNSYSSQPVTVTPKARKTLANPSGTLRLLNADEFTFELQDANGKTLQSKANKADGTVTFDKITYDTVGEHDYRIIEQSGKLAGITYDQTVHMMHVTVADNGYGQLKATVTYDDGKDTPVFTNTYNPKDATVTLTAHKTFGNANNSHAKLTDFQFQLFDNEQAVGVPVQTVNADRNGDVRFQPLTFTASQLKGNKSKTFTYTVREIRQSAGGVNYDSHMGMWQITVTDDLTGQLKAQTRTNAAYPTTFTNTYQAKPVSVQFRAHKTLNDPDHTGIQLQAGQYEFKCVEDKTGGQAGTVKTNDQQGNILFDTISYTKTGVYDYTLSEVHGDKGGITYDATKHHVKVTVTDNGEGQLLADVKYDGGEAVPEFTNSYKAQPATDTLNAVKTVTASEGNHYKLKGDDFTFALHRVTAPNGVTAEADQTKANDAQGNIRFDQLSFPLPGTYVYTVSERDTTVPGITKDGTVTTITYTVKDVDHAGRLKVVDKTITRSDGKTANGIRFNNTYNPKGVGYTLGGVKTIINTDTETNRIPQDGEFTFKLTSHDGAPMPKGSKDGVKTVHNTGTGFTFGRMDYSKPGTYVYTVTEQADRDSTIGYSTQAYDVTVTVADNGGMLAASADRQANDIRFDNTYTPTPASVQLEADKHLTGRGLNDNEFSAELKDSNGNLLQTKQFTHSPRNTQSDKATAREGNGTLDFDKLTFDKTGVYTYTVDEQDGTLGGVTYDNTIHTVTITVTEDAKSHRLVASVAYSNGKASEKSILFQNTYQPEDVLVGLSAKKNLTGRELQAYEFEFELVDDKGNVIDSEKNDKQGNIQFKPLTYGRDNDGVDDCGEYRYVIREKNTGEKNVTYDKTEHHVTVTVSDNLRGNLTAKVQYDPTDDTAKDSSTMLVTPTDKADKTDGDAGEDENNPTTTPSMVTTTGTQPEFNNSYIPPVTPAIVKTIRQLAKTGVSTPTVALAAFTLLGVELTVAYSVRRRHAVTPRHRR